MVAMRREKPSLQEVRAFWEKHPAGYDQIAHLEDDPLAFLEERDRQTRLLSPKIRENYRMARAAGKRTLDIGCGQGFNAQELVTCGARLTAMDLTSKGLSLARSRFNLRGLKADFVQASAERMPFAEGVFEFVHSSGVLHHTPDIERAVAEMHRVMAPGAEASVMLYNKNSIAYRYNICIKMRLLMTFLFLLPAGARAGLLSRRPGLRQYVPARWPTSSDVLNASTDFGGVENPLSRVYTHAGARRLFARFTVTGFAASHGVYKPGKDKSPLEGLIARLYEKVMGRWGWYLFIHLRKDA